MTINRSFFENLIMIIILLSIVHLVSEELSIIQDWNLSFRIMLIIIGFIIDLIFTIEFFLRFMTAAWYKRLKYYFLEENGWIDFLCSIPLVLFSSGPQVLTLFMGMETIVAGTTGILGILKITKILRISRILRLLRVLKISFEVSYNEAEKKLTQMNKIISICVLVTVFILIITPFIPGLFFSQNGSISEDMQKYRSILNQWQKSQKPYNSYKIKRLTTILKEDKNVLYMKYGKRTVINNLGKKGYTPEKVLPEKYLYTDFQLLNLHKFSLWCSVKDTRKKNSKVNLLLIIIIISQMAAFMIIYNVRPKPKSIGISDKGTKLPDFEESVSKPAPSDSELEKFPSTPESTVPSTLDEPSAPEPMPVQPAAPIPAETIMPDTAPSAPEPTPAQPATPTPAETMMPDTAPSAPEPMPVQPAAPIPAETMMPDTAPSAPEPTPAQPATPTPAETIMPGIVPPAPGSMPVQPATPAELTSMEPIMPDTPPPAPETIPVQPATPATPTPTEPIMPDTPPPVPETIPVQPATPAIPTPAETIMPGTVPPAPETIPVQPAAPAEIVPSSEPKPDENLDKPFNLDDLIK